MSQNKEKKNNIEGHHNTAFYHDSRVANQFLNDKLSVLWNGSGGGKKGKKHTRRNIRKNIKKRKTRLIKYNRKKKKTHKKRKSIFFFPQFKNINQRGGSPNQNSNDKNVLIDNLRTKKNEFMNQVEKVNKAKKYAEEFISKTDSHNLGAVYDSVTSSLSSQQNLAHFGGVNSAWISIPTEMFNITKDIAKTGLKVVGIEDIEKVLCQLKYMYINSRLALRKWVNKCNESIILTLLSSESFKDKPTNENDKDFEKYIVEHLPEHILERYKDSSYIPPWIQTHFTEKHKQNEDTGKSSDESKDSKKEIKITNTEAMPINIKLKK